MFWATESGRWMPSPRRSSVTIPTCACSSSGVISASDRAARSSGSVPRRSDQARSTPAEARCGPNQAAPTGRRSRRLRISETDVVQARRGGRARRPSAARRRPPRPAARIRALGFGNAEHQMHDLGGVDLRHRRSPDRLAIAHDRDALADREYLVEEMRDVDDRRRLPPSGPRMTSKSRSRSGPDSDDVGSSKMMIRACCRSARAISTSCRSPMLSCSTGVCGEILHPRRASSDFRLAHHFGGPDEPAGRRHARR